MRRAVSIASKIGGGPATIEWALTADPFQVDVVFLACNRMSVSESLQYVPLKEIPSKEFLQNYRVTNRTEEDLAWDPDVFVQLCAWLANRERIRREKESRES